MSVNYKNANNYSALLNEIKASSLNDKVKGRNHKMYVKRVHSQDKSESMTMKAVTNQLNDLNHKYASIDLKKQSTVGGLTDQTAKTSEDLKRRNQSISSGINQDTTPHGNKIDIKISVNYNKPTITNSVNYPNSNSSSGLSSSKSFYNNTQNPNQISNAYIQSNNQSHYVNSTKPEMIKNIKQSSFKPENNFNVSSINLTNEEKFKEKLIDNKLLGKNILAASGLGLNHLRNKSQNLNFFDQNSLNISLMGYENKNLKNYLLNQGSGYNPQSANNANKLVLSHFKSPSLDKSSNQSFAFNNRLISRLTDSNVSNTPIRNERKDKSFNHVDTTDCNLTKGNTEQNFITTDLNMKDFTLNKNNEDSSALDNNDRREERNNYSSNNKFLILETKLADQLSTIKETWKTDEKGSSNTNKNTKTISLSNLGKKYVTYKKISEEYLNLIQGDSHNINLLKKLFEGFHDTVRILFDNNKKISEKLTDYDSITSNNKILKKKYADLYKAFEEKSEEAKQLKSKLNQANSSNNPSNLNKKIEKERNPNSIHEQNLNLSNTNNIRADKTKVNLDSKNPHVDNSPVKGNDTSAEINRSRMIKMMNRNVLDDLDAIYFFDKIDMRSNSASHKKIPKLDFNFLGENNLGKKGREDKAEKKELQQNLLENMKHHKKISLKLEDLVAVPDEKKHISGNSVINLNKQSGLTMTNQSNTMNYSNMKKLSNQFLKNSLGQSGLNMK